MSGDVRPALTPSPGGRERGSSLVELVVVMLIMGIITIALTSLVIGFQRTSAQNVARQDQIETARAGVERVAKTLRTAVKPSRLTTTCNQVFCDLDAFLLAQPNAVRFYANLDNQNNAVGPSFITYAVSGTGDLVETVQRPLNPHAPPSGYEYCDTTLASASTACKKSLTTRVVARGVQPGTGLFAYYDTDGHRLIPPAAGLSATDLESVLSIELTLRVQAPQAQAAPTTYIQRITLPNSQSVIRQGTVTP